MSKALLVGINQYAVQSGLFGCVNDVEDVKAALVARRAVAAGDIEVLVDAAATRQAILAALATLVESLGTGERGYFHFSGHGVRMDSADPNEPDGLDEVLCPHEFDWSAPTAITDNDVLDVVGSLKLGARLVVTIDSCHSGDFSRALLRRGSIPRTLVPPPGRVLRRGATVTGLRALSRAPNVTFVSAVSPWQLAADTAFEGRANGAFTHFFLAEVDRSLQPLAEVVAAIEPLLRPYEMTPVAEHGELPYFAAASRPADGAISRRELVAPALARAVTVRAGSVVFEQQWTASLLGQPMTVAVRISAHSGELTADVTARVLGVGHTVPAIRIAGNLRRPISLGALGIMLELEISGWRNDGRSIHLDLELGATFGDGAQGRLRIARVPVEIDLGGLSRSLVTSPAELLAAFALQGPPPDMGMPRASREARIQVAASGVAGWGPNWREDRVIRPFQDRPRPDGITRHSVDIGPQRGSGNVYVVDWLSDQETDFDFILHMGNHFFGGWGDIDWRVHAVYADIQPFPRDPGVRSFLAPPAARGYRSFAR